MKEMIDAIALSTGESRSEIKRILEAFMDITAQTLANNQEVDLGGFGTFYTEFVPARILQDLETQEIIRQGKKKRPKFKAGSELSAKVNLPIFEAHTQERGSRASFTQF